MRTSLTEIRDIEEYLSGSLNEEALNAFQAKLRADVGLRLQVRLQRHVILLLKAYRRKMLRKRAAEIHQKLFRDPEKRDFQHRVAKLFNP